MALLSLMGADAQAPTELPRLVVNILVDQLRTDYLETFAPLYGEDGFKLLMSQGQYYSDVQQPFQPVDRASATATIVTGAVPRQHGVPSLSWLSRKTLQPVFCVDDSRYTGLETSEKSSPNYLVAPTVTDELKHATARRAIVVSIAPERDMAVLLGGHVADGAFWLSDERGLWAGTSFYGQMPAWVAQYNASESPAKRIARMTWESTYDNAYPSFLYYHAIADEKAKNFKHTFSGDNRYRDFKTSALVNDEVVSLACHCAEATRLGLDHTPDMLAVGLYAGTFQGQEPAQCPSELQDTYVRLDIALGRLISTLRQRLGKDRVVFVVSSTGYDGSAYNPTIAAGTFNSDRAAKLLNMYLSAKYGQAQYVEASFGCQIYIDHKVVEQHQLLVNDVLAECEAFLSQMEGVADVYSPRSLVLGGFTPELTLIRNGWSAVRSGDLIVDVCPGWKIVTEQNTEYNYKGHPYTSYPLFILAPDTEPMKVTEQTSADVIAPTLASCLRIRAPNGSRAAPLRLTR